MKINGTNIVVAILGLYFLVSIPSLVLSTFTHAYNIVFSITANTPSLYGNLLAGAWWWIAILIAGVGVYLIKIRRSSLVKSLN